MAHSYLPPSDHDSDPEEEEEEEEDEQVDADVINPDAKSDSEEDDDDEAEEESSEKTASPVKGLDYESDADSGKSVPTPSASDFIVKKTSKSKKRSAESEAVKESSDSKKLKSDHKKKKENVVAVAEDKAKRSTGLRIWGPEDEIMILTGMVDYKEKTGVDFNANLDSFYNFIKGQLNAVVDRTQLVNKIRKLKEKYRDNAAKEANGETPVFSKSHEEDVFEYSKRVWGGNTVVRSKPKKKEKEIASEMVPVLEVDNVLALPVPDIESGKKEVNGGSAKVGSRVQKVVKKPKVEQKMEFVEADSEMVDSHSVFHMPLMAEWVVFKKGFELVEKSKVDALNEKWTKYQIDAAELYVRRLDLIKQQTELILDALKSSRR